ncbi:MULTISPECIES: type IV secretory system conjugative DNA transfer family protein [Bacillus cereus group]|uniref:Conjugal transfer protein TraG n=1 Tax=Bacillus thuringiensis TaxID=1428 RepID=A0A9X6Z5H6_BACTU|nr:MULTISPECIES: type IV secretory system conjugative DNA transfer family protein [Bacillus cereus group]MCU5282350.1 type IV secretory system conjugative DNA transfer family protein [Bacillus cereus]MEC3270563.1 type IV secretory system conjugative DNA transfer family protein [Bacillus thuringiensis]PFB08201.1 conjugal transfer protein TraG [Bacillus thuringiensis]
MSNKIAELKNNPTLKQLGENINGIMIGLFAFQCSMFITILLFKKSFFFIHLGIALLIILGFSFLKDFADEKKKSFALKIMKTSLVIGALSIFDHFIVSGLNHIEDPKLYSSMTKVIYLVDFAIIISSIAIFRNEEFQNKMIAFTETSIWNALAGEEKEEIKQGDAVLGKNIDTQNPVILPLKDRYLHMLVLGPTGSGKTSQTIIPMIHRDMQNPELGVTVIEPKGDLAEKIFAMARYYNREVQYFNPILPDCPYFNPLFGDESDVIENMATTFKMLNPDSPQFFLDMNENLIRNALKVLKRLYGDDATLIDLSTLLHNTGGGGKKMVQDFSKLPSESDSMAKENNDIALWFLNDYFTGATGDKGATKTYEHCSGVRSQVAKLVSNKYLRRVLNPPKGRGSDVDFDKSLAEGTIITIATAQGKLRDLGKYLGYFIILQLQSAVFRRPGNENTRRGNMLYIDEFQTYSNPGFADMLTQGRSYRVASHLATQNRALIGMGSGKDGKDFIELVSTNARNTIIYPGGNAQDADYYSKQFGEIIEKTMQKGYSQEKFSVLGGLGRRPVNESFREAEETKARYSPTDIIYREFGQITYCLIKNNSIQAPGVSKIEYIPKELNDLLDRMVAEYNEEQDKKYHKEFGGSQKPTEEKKVELVKEKLNEEAVVTDIQLEKPKNNYSSNDVVLDPLSEIEDDTFVDAEDVGAKVKSTTVISENEYQRGGNSFQSNINDVEDELI